MTSIVSTEHLDELQSAIQALRDQDTGKALEILQGVLQQDPEVPEALHLLGLCSALLGDLGRGIELISEAHDIDGECRDYVDALAFFKAKMGDLNESLYFAKLATTLEAHPSLSELLPSSMQNYAGALASANISTLIIDAQVHFSRRLFALAAETCEKELRLKPTSVDALRLLGMSLFEIGEHPRATVAFHAAEQIEPGNPETITALARCLVLQGRNDEALACFEHAQAQGEDDTLAAAIAAHIQALSFMDDEHWQTRSLAEDAFLANAKNMEIEPMEGGDIPPAGKIRIAILSSHFYNCDEAQALETFLTHYNRNQFEVFCLQQSSTNDKMTDRLKAQCDSWRPVFDLDDWVLADIISSDGIQALIDTSGYGPGQRRATLSTRPAPLQVAWLNHLDGTGKDTIDLVLADAATIHNDRRTALDGQDVAELETGLFTFPEFGLMGDVGPLPALEHDTITFGAYADLGRVNARTAMTWCQILKAVPRSLLVLNVAPNLPDNIRAGLAARFAHFGMTKRISFLSNEPNPESPQTDDTEQHFLSGVDILLDPPVNASYGRLARALWMGVPVLTQDPGRRSGQVAASVLMAAGKGEWVAKTSVELVDTARALASDYQALATIRKTLRDDISDSALFKGRDFAREIENAIRMALEDREII